MINRLLIANRGEIALRVARTAHRLGIEAVGIYSEPDATGMYLDVMDLAVALGGESAAESYLRGERIIEAALRAECDAVHPGYGFLAENADFAQQVTDAGLTWVGPAPEHIRLLGDKIAAKQAAAAAGVPTTAVITAGPGDIPSEVQLPALVKAAAGGGGRGMRVVRSRDELGDALDAAAREAHAAFGDGTVFIEPFIEHGRHVEVQVIADQHGSVIHLGERECSIQRRNQKIVEEAPSAGIGATTRAELCEGAVELIRHVGYANAATVEYMVGQDGTITFLEVNTRLQVEHPVTEAVTGIDLVELQLLVAAGDRLPIEQDDVVISGHAIEVRVVAENPRTGWLPSTGELQLVEFGPGVRVDSGVRTGSVVSPHYDSMIAKIIGHGTTRAEAARRLRRALRCTRIEGVDHNLATLAAIMAEPDYLAARTPTSYLDSHPEVTQIIDDPGLELVIGAALAVEEHHRGANQATGFAPSGWRNLRTQGQRRQFEAGDQTYPLEYWIDGDHIRVRTGDWPEPGEDGALAPDDRADVEVRILARDRHHVVVEIDGVRHRVETDVRFDHDDATVIHARTTLTGATLSLPSVFVVPDRAHTGGGPICPLPGTVLAVHVSAGQTVREGDVLMVVEAMKMEHKITAGFDGLVSDVHFGAGDRVDSGDLLVTLEAEQ